MSTSEWLSKQFLEFHLRNHYKSDGLTIDNFEIKPGSAKGIGYFSTMHRVNVTLTIPSTDSSTPNRTLTRSLMVKEAISDAAALSALEQYNVYNKEIEFYEKVSPKINEKLRDLDEPQLLAECFGVCHERKAIIMEDLAAKGYGILPTTRGFNIPESKLILKRLSALHAVCATLQEQQPNIFDNFKNGRFSREMSAFNDFYMGNFDAAVEVISSWPDFTKYADKLRRIRNEVIERSRRDYDVKPNHFNSLNQDDLFAPNLMLKLKKATDGIPFENVVFIDFQLAYWNSPTTDLNYFLNTSVAEPLRPHCFNELVEYYHGELSGFLTRLKYKRHIPNWQEFQQQYQSRYFAAFVIACLLLPILAHNTECVSFDVLVQNNEEGMQSRRKIYQAKPVQQILRKFIPYYNALGTFD